MEAAIALGRVGHCRRGSLVVSTPVAPRRIETLHDAVVDVKLLFDSHCASVLALILIRGAVIGGAPGIGSVGAIPLSGCGG